MSTSMNRTWSYPRALEELWRRSRYERGFISDPFGGHAAATRGLRRMRALLRELGNPQATFSSVHIAGSKGKGSTGAFIAAIAAAAGYRVGHYSSPHLHRFPERIAINGHPLRDEQFAAVARRVATAAGRVESSSPDLDQVTTFEFVTAMAFLAFADRACDLAMIEVGLGGTYDATNVIAPAVSAITRIDLEHTAVLGTTYAEIAAQKAGILRPGVPAVSSPQVPAAADTISAVANQVGAPLLIGGTDWEWTGGWRSFTATGPWGTVPDLALGVPGPHQVENACTALAAVHVLTDRGALIPGAAIRAGLLDTRWPARFEKVAIAGRVVVLDGAHTPAAAAALVATWREMGLPSGATVVLGMGADKDPAAFLAALRPLIGRLVITRADSPRAADPAVIAEAAAALAIPHSLASSVGQGVVEVAEDRAAPLLVTGSLFVAAEAREALGMASPDRDWQALNRSARTRRELSRPPTAAPK